MGLLDIFRKKQALAPEPEQRELPLEGVVDFYKSTYRASLAQSEERARQFQGEALSLFDSLPLTPLAKASFEAQDRKYAAVNMAKNTYVTRVKSLLSTLPSEGPSLEEFLQACTAILAGIKNASPKQGVILSQYFKKEAEAMVLHLKKIESVLSSAGTFLASEGKPLRLVRLLEAGKGGHDLLARQRDGLAGREKSLEGEIREKLLLREREGQMLQSFLAGKEWQEAGKRGEEIQLLEKELREIEEKILAELGSLLRLLKKTRHAQENRMIDHFLSEPLPAFLAENGGKNLHDILALAGQLHGQGILQLKESEKQRLAAASPGLEDLARLRENHHALSKESQSKAREQDPAVQEEKKRRESTLDSLDAQLRNLREERERVGKEKQSLEKQIAAKKVEMENAIRELAGERVTVV